MPPSVTVAAFVFGLVLSIAALIGRDIKIVAVEIPALTGGTRFSVGILGIILMAFGLFNIPERFFAPTSPPPIAVPTTSATPQPTNIRVLVDAYHSDPYFDIRSFDGSQLQAHNITLEVSQRPFSLAELSQYDAVIIWFGKYSQNKAKFSPEEIKAIRDYINQGGGAFLVGLGWLWTGDNNKIEEYPLNIIAQDSGITFTAQSINMVKGVHYSEAPIVFHRPFMKEHPVTQDVNQIAGSMAAPGVLLVEKQAIPLIWGDDDTKDNSGISNPIILAASTMGKGKIICLNHPNYAKIFTNEYKDKQFPNIYDNSKLLENILLWLGSK